MAILHAYIQTRIHCDRKIYTARLPKTESCCLCQERQASPCELRHEAEMLRQSERSVSALRVYGTGTTGAEPLQAPPFRLPY